MVVCGLALILMGLLYVASQPKSTFVSPSPPPPSGPPKGPPPALPAGFPPVYPGAQVSDTRSTTIDGGWSRAFVYASNAKPDEIASFYRKELIQSGMQLMASGGGPYGAMLRLQNEKQKRAVSVDIDAPEDRPKDQPAKITVTVVDTE